MPDTTQQPSGDTSGSHPLPGANIAGRGNVAKF
jgi:hypothetical protein